MNTKSLKALLNGPIFLASAIALVSASYSLCADLATSSEPFSFTILHSNDLHSHEQSFVERGKLTGGIARIGHLIKAAKSKSDRVLAIDAGDIFQGTPYFETYKGRTEIECLNKCGYDIFAIGNHEFDEGPENLAEQLQYAKFDIVSANLDPSAVPSLAKLVKPTVVKTIGGQKIGFVGVITPYLNDVAPSLQGVKLKASGQDWYRPIQIEVDKLKAQGINKIIAVSHSGVEVERDLAEKVPDLDAIIGGHSHTRLEKPIIVPHKDGSHCFVVQTGSYCRALGRLELTFDAAGRVIVPKTRYHLIDINGRIWEDPDVAAYVHEMGKPFAALRTTICGAAQGYFDNRFKNHSSDSPLGNLICDALLSSAKKEGAIIAFQNRGGIRGRIEPGMISLEKVREILPFKNKLVIATLDGNTLMRALEHSVSGSSGAKFFDVSGMKIAYDTNKEPGKRIVFALVQPDQASYVLEPVEPTKKYRIAVNDFSFNGGEGYDFKTATDVKRSDLKISEVFQDYLSQEKKVKPSLPTRIIEVDSNMLSTSSEDGVSSNKARQVKLNCGLANADIKFFVAAKRGIDFIPGTGPIPLQDARTVGKSYRTDGQGHLLVYIKDLLKPGKDETKNGQEKLWLTAVAKKYQSGHTKKLIAAPIFLNSK